MIGDKGFGTDTRVVIPLEQVGKIVVIPLKASCKESLPNDPELYKAGHLIENFFVKPKPFGAMASVMINPPSTSWPASILPLPSFGSIEDTPLVWSVARQMPLPFLQRPHLEMPDMEALDFPSVEYSPATRPKGAR